MASEPTIGLASSGKLRLTFWRADVDNLPARSHSIELPNSERGLALLNWILSSRGRGQTQLGQDGNPTQHVIEQWLANKKETDAITKREDDKRKDDEVLACF